VYLGEHDSAPLGGPAEAQVPNKVISTTIMVTPRYQGGRAAMQGRAVKVPCQSSLLTYCQESSMLTPTHLVIALAAPFQHRTTDSDFAPWTEARYDVHFYPIRGSVGPDPTCHMAKRHWVFSSFV